MKLEMFCEDATRQRDELSRIVKRTVTKVVSHYDVMVSQRKGPATALMQPNTMACKACPHRSKLFLAASFNLGGRFCATRNLPAARCCNLLAVLADPQVYPVHSSQGVDLVPHFQSGDDGEADRRLLACRGGHGRQDRLHRRAGCDRPSRQPRRQRRLPRASAAGL